MILVFYLVLPLIARPPVIAAAAIGGGLWVLMLALDRFHPIDARILMFFPAFVAGALWRRAEIRPGAWALALLGGAALASFWWTRQTGTDSLTAALVSIPAVVLGSLLATVLAVRWGGRIGDTAVVRWLSYASFSIYLFHRVVIELARRIHWPADDADRLLYLLLVCLPLCLVVGWALQRGYDGLLAWRQRWQSDRWHDAGRGARTSQALNTSDRLPPKNSKL